MRSVHRQIETATVLVQGHRIRYAHTGFGPPLVLVHGLLGSLQNWRFNFEPLGQIRSVYALDQLNTGGSDRVPDLDASLEAIADRIIAFMDVLGLARADIAAHSHGGAVALTLAARHPQRVDHMILFAPVNPFSTFGLRLIRFYVSPFGRLVANLVPSLPRWGQRIALARMYGVPPRIAPDTLEGYTAGLEVHGTIPYVLRMLGGWQADIARLRSALPLLADKPILLVWGDRDRAVDLRSARPLQAILHRSTLAVVPTAGHVPFEELPDICNQLMIDHLGSPPKSGADS